MEMPDMRQVGRFIRIRREMVGLTQCDLAEQLHLTDNAVSKWERGLSLPDSAILPTLSSALGVTEGEILRGRERRSLKKYWRGVWAFSSPWRPLLWTAAWWLSVLLLMEPVGLFLQRAYLDSGRSASSFLSISHPYGVAYLAVFTLPSLVAGLWMSRTVHRQKPFPALGGSFFAVWARYCLPGLAISFALWFFIFCLVFWDFTDIGFAIAQLGWKMAEWIPTGPNSRTIALSWHNLPYFILNNFLNGTYCFRALVFSLFYGIGVARYLSRKIM